MTQAEPVTVTGSVAILGGHLGVVPAQPPDRIGDPDDIGLTLDGEKLPVVGQRVEVRGTLHARVLDVSDWEPAPESAWAWSTVRPVKVAGIDEAIAHEVVDAVPEGYCRSIGESKAMNGRYVVELQVDRLTDEVVEWVAEQPPGSVLLYPFITPAALAGCVAIAH